MPPQLASLICVIFIIYLFWTDIKKSEGTSRALWIPQVWMWLSASRSVSEWMNLRSSDMISLEDMYDEGSPTDMSVYTFLIIAAVAVLLRRKINWGELFKNNWMVWLFFLYALISILWSDFPLISFKRWAKTMGTVSMALVILTEERPYVAAGLIMRRLAFLLLPLSYLFIMYYPSLGRAYHQGMPMITGVTSHKNALGALCMLSGLYFCWDLLINRRGGGDASRRLTYAIYLVMLAMIAFFIFKANSATTVACMVAAICFFLVTRLPAVAREPRRIVAIAISFLVVYGALELFFDVSKTVAAMLGRDENLTTRVPIWQEVLLPMAKNPTFGFGYEAFWVSERMTHVWEKTGTTIITAHNGYLDLYLSLGLAGLCLLLMGIITGTAKTIKHLSHEYAYAILRISLIMVFLLQNYTESTFKPLSNMVVFLLIGILEMPGGKMNQKQNQVPATEKDQMINHDF